MSRPPPRRALLVFFLGAIGCKDPAGGWAPLDTDSDHATDPSDAGLGGHDDGDGPLDEFPDGSVVDDVDAAGQPAPHDAGDEPAGDAAQMLPSCAEAAAACSSPVYPCLDLQPSGYTCEGLHAEWPMPSTAPGAKAANSYDTASVAGVTIDRVTRLWWEREPPGTTSSWADADARCAGLVLGGEGDWRLPSMLELFSLLDESAVDAPVIDRAAFPHTLAADFWSATRPSEVQALVVAFDIDWAYRHADLDVARASRCVRGAARGPFTPAQRYVIDAASDTVTDTRTGLVWQRTVGDPLVYAAAEAHCAALGAGFRIPTFKELFTLVDRSRIRPSIDPVFPDTPSTPFWTAVSRFGSKLELNAVVFDDGEPDALARTSVGHVRCVR
jgi:hypothetical protein